MELSELQTNQSAKIATRALKEHFNQNLNLDAMGISETRTMLGKVRNLLSTPVTSVTGLSKAIDDGTSIIRSLW